MSGSSNEVALEAEELGKRYRRRWALKGCSFTLPVGRVSALVGPNGAGKSTLMGVMTGLLSATAGKVRVLGMQPGRKGTHPGLAFLAQEKPLFRHFTVGDMLKAGKAMNAQWDATYARTLVDDARVPITARIHTLSGGQRTRVALALAMGRRPQILMLDEPLAELDPLARQEVMQAVMQEVAETGMTVLLSSHVLNDVEAVCDHMLLLADGRVQIGGDVEDLLSSHRLLIGPSSGSLPVLPSGAAVEVRTVEKHTTALVRGSGVVVEYGWESLQPTLEELTLSYLRVAAKGAHSADGGAAA